MGLWNWRGLGGDGEDLDRVDDDTREFFPFRGTEEKLSAFCFAGLDEI